MIFTLFPHKDSLGLFFYHSGHNETKSVEFAFVAIRVRLAHMITELYSSVLPFRFHRDHSRTDHHTVLHVKSGARPNLLSLILQQSAIHSLGTSYFCQGKKSEL